MLPLLACADPAPVSDEATLPSATAIEAELSTAVVTVIRVRWTTSEPSVGYVTFGETAAYGRSTPVEGTAGVDHEALLLGMPADTEVHFSVVTVQGGASEDHTITTGTLPGTLPVFTVTGEVESWTDAYVVVPVQGVSHAVVVLDDGGRVVWYVEDEPGFYLRSLLTVDRGSLLYYRDTDEPGDPFITRVSIDGETTEHIDVPRLDHDFTEIEDGTLAVLADGDLGAGIVEQDRDGGRVDIWNAWEDPALAALLDQGHSLGANAIDYVAEHDAYYVSFKDLGSIVKVDRATGTALWHLNGLANEFALGAGTSTAEFSHQFQVLDDGIVVFDNGTPDRGWSQLLELEVDEGAMTADLRWSFQRDPTVYVYAVGDVHRFADGNTEVVWSTSGEIQDIDDQGAVHWQLSADLGYVFGYVQHVPSLYPGG